MVLLSLVALHCVNSYALAPYPHYEEPLGGKYHPIFGHGYDTYIYGTYEGHDPISTYYPAKYNVYAHKLPPPTYYGNHYA